MYIGFKKLKSKLAHKKGKSKVDNPAAVAAAIGIKKYGKKKMMEAAHSHHKLKKAVHSAHVAVVSMGGGKHGLSASPKATGVAGKFSLGKTGGGHAVSSYSHKESNKGWSKKDHMDAYRAHFKHVSSLSQDSTVHKDLLTHHKEAMQHHWKAANADDVKKALIEWLFKAKRKKYRNKVIGKTVSGKAVYSHHKHHEHKHFSEQDHKEAAHIHHEKVLKLLDKMMHSKGHIHALLGKLLKHHGEGAYHHHHHGHKEG